MAEEKRIAYKAGITRNPSDFLCGDGELAECINLATDNEELKTMVPPSEYIHSSNIPKILYIHKHNVSDRYIVLREASIYWGVRNSDGSFAYNSTYDLLMTVDGTPKVTSIGKTLIIADNTGMHYFLWKEDSYLGLGEIPEVKLEFWMVPNNTVESSANTSNCVDSSSDNQTHTIKADKHSEYNDLVIGLYSENKKKAAQSKCFCNPFFIRTAIQLYDGTYTHISQPILMFPAVTANTYCFYYDRNWMRMFTVIRSLRYNDSSDFSGWEDVIKKVVVFISDGIDVWDTGIDQHLERADGKIIHNGITRSLQDTASCYNQTRAVGSNNFWEGMVKKAVNDIFQELSKTSIFYKLCELTPNYSGIIVNTTQGFDMGYYFGTHTLENITTQERLEYDDYYSRCPLVPSMLFPYNGRLNISGVSRGFFEGYDFFMPNDNYRISGTSVLGVTNNYSIFVTIKTDSGERIVRHNAPAIKQRQGIYFYYPDPRASHVRIIKNGSDCVCDRSLKEHPGLNGAYYFRLEGLSDDSDLTAAFNEITDNANNQQDSFVVNPGDEIQTNVEPEQLPNYIIQSEVNNPMVFKAESYNRVGTGRILAMSTLTMALSQDPYGRTDLLVFSESGLWGMEVDRTGLYENLHPYTRDVCINPSNIIQTDFAVFFVSKKGLMKITDNGVSCVSEQMNGVTFNTDDMPGYEDIAHEDPSSPAYPWAGVIRACQEEESSFLSYIRNSSCVMAYDYIDGRIYIINPNYPFCYVYNMIDGSISKTVLEAKITNTVNNYPDYLLQGKIDNQSVVYSLYEKPREEEVRDRVMAYLLTRPMKLAGAVSQASLREMVNVGMWKRTDDNGNELSCVKSEVFVSSDMQEWYPLSSRFGAAARYFRLALYMKMLPTERLSGTIIRVQERREEHMRK